MFSLFVRSGVGVKHVLDKTELWSARAPEKKLKKQKKICFIAPLKKMCCKNKSHHGKISPKSNLETSGHNPRPVHVFVYGEIRLTKCGKTLRH